MTAHLRDLLHTPYELGGRQVGVGIDCLGTVAEVARRRGLPPPDGWPSIRAAWENGTLAAASGFPDGWIRMPAATGLRDGDVLLFVSGAHPWCAIVDAGFVISAHPDRGPYAVPMQRWREAPVELWRFLP